MKRVRDAETPRSRVGRQARPARRHHKDNRPPPALSGQGRVSKSGKHLVETIRCARCAALMFKAEAGALRGTLEIKCRRCGAMNSLRPVEAARSERRSERLSQGETHATNQTQDRVR